MDRRRIVIVQMLVFAQMKMQRVVLVVQGLYDMVLILHILARGYQVQFDVITQHLETHLRML